MTPACPRGHDSVYVLQKRHSSRQSGKNSDLDRSKLILTNCFFQCLNPYHTFFFFHTIHCFLIITITLQDGRVRVSHKKTKILGGHLLKATNLVRQPRFKPEFEFEAHICPFSHLIAFPLISCIHKADKFNRSVLITIRHFSLTSHCHMLHIQVK